MKKYILLITFVLTVISFNAQNNCNAIRQQITVIENRISFLEFKVKEYEDEMKKYDDFTIDVENEDKFNTAKVKMNEVKNDILKDKRTKQRLENNLRNCK